MFRVYTMYQWYHHVIHVQGIHHVSVVSPCNSCSGYTPCISGITMSFMFRVYTMYQWYYMFRVYTMYQWYSPPCIMILPCFMFRVYTMYQWYYHVIHVQGIHHVSVILPCHSCSGYTPCISDITMSCQGIHHVSVVIHVQGIHMYQWYYHVIHFQGIRPWYKWWYHVMSCSGYTPCIGDITI